MDRTNRYLLLPAAWVMLFLSCTPKETKVLLGPSEALGTVLAEEAARMAGAKKQAAIISPDAKWAFHTCSTFDNPPVTDLVQLSDHKVGSPEDILKVGDEVEVTAMAPEEECEHEMFVMIPWERHGLAVPLSQLKANATDESTRQGIEDWHYWVKQGYEF